MRNSKPRDTALKAIGIYQIAGGIIGLAFGLYDLIFKFRFNLFFLLYGTIAIGLFLLPIFAGVACVDRKRQHQNLTVLNQLIQLISFSIFGFSYTYNSGLGAYIGLDLTTLIEFSYKVIWPYVGLGKVNSETVRLLINVTPIVVLFIYGQIIKDHENA